MPKVWQSEHVEPQQKRYERIKVKTRHWENKSPMIIKSSQMANNRRGHKLPGTTLTRANEAKTGSNRTYHDKRMDLCLKAMTKEWTCV